jgi:DNA-binding XRE family transcriptional regulator
LTRLPTFALYGEEGDPAPSMLHIESIDSRRRLHDREIDARRHQGLHQVLWLRTGQAEAMLDETRSTCQAPAVLPVPPGVVQAFRFSPHSDGCVLTVNASLLAEGETAAASNATDSAADSADGSVPLWLTWAIVWRLALVEAHCHLDHRDLGPGHLVAHRVHALRGMQRQQARRLDGDAAFGDARHRHALLGQQRCQPARLVLERGVAPLVGIDVPVHEVAQATLQGLHLGGGLEGHGRSRGGRAAAVCRRRVGRPAIQPFLRIQQKQHKVCKSKIHGMTCMPDVTDFPVRTADQLPGLLQGFRKAGGLTQAEVATRLGVTQQTLSAMERNAGNVSAARLMKLLAILGVELVLRQPGGGADAGPLPAAPPPQW